MFLVGGAGLMAGLSGSIARSVTAFTDELGQMWTSLITAVVYVGCIGYCTTAVVLLFTNNTAPWTKALGFSSVLVSGTSHFTIYFMGMGFVNNFIKHARNY